jgi:hypothetical protein
MSLVPLMQWNLYIGTNMSFLIQFGLEGQFTYINRVDYIKSMEYMTSADIHYPKRSRLSLY